MDDTLYKNLTNSTQELEKMSELLSSIYNELNRINDGFKNMGNNLISNAFGDFSAILSMVNGLNTLSTTVRGVTEAGAVATTTFGNFTQVLSSISSVSLFVTALTGIVSVVQSIVTHTIDATSKTDDYIKKLNEKSAAIHENNEEMKRNNEIMIDNANSIKVDYGFMLKQVDELVKLTGENGYISNLSNARYLVDQINKVLPNSVSITEKGTLAWGDNTKSAQENVEAIKEGIRELEKRELLESMSKDVAEAFSKRKQYEIELIEAKRAHKIAQDNLTEAEEKHSEIFAKEGPNNYYAQKFVDAKKALEAQNIALEEAEKQFAINEKVIRSYSAVQESLSNHIEGTAKQHLEFYTEIGDKGIATWESLTNALIDLDQQQKIHIENGYNNQDEEVKINARTTELIMEQCIARADSYKLSFEDMISTLKEEGVTLTDKELKEWQKQYNNYYKNVRLKEELQDCFYDNMIEKLEVNGVALDEKSQQILNQEIEYWMGNAKSKEEIQALNMETLLLNLEDAGIKLNETQKNLLREGSDDWKAQAIEKEEIFDTSMNNLIAYLLDSLSYMNSESSSKAIELINILKDGGIEGGSELCKKLAKSLEDNGGKVTDETMDIIEQILALVNDNKPVSQINVIGQSSEAIKLIIENMQRSIGQLNLPIWLQPVMKGFEIAGKFFRLNVVGLADGGFPDTGELFVAREAGPELVGRINSKTAVANNDQIVSGISSGVYNAMIGAMSKGNRNNTTVTAIFQVDGKQVAKQVINAHNKEVIQTGRSPLLI